MSGNFTPQKLGRLLWAALLAFTFSSSAEGAGGKPDYDAALSAYQAKNYKLAAEKFKSCIVAGNTSPMIMLYEGHAYLGAGDRAHAIEAYGQLADKFPASPEAQLGIQCLLRLDPSLSIRYHLSSPVAAAAPVSTANAKSAATLPAQGPAAATKTTTTNSSTNNGMLPNVPLADPKKHLSERIVVVPPRGNHPAVGYATISTVRDIVNRIPRHMYKYLDEGGATINLAPNIEDKWPGSGDGKKVTVADGTMGEEPGRTYGRDVHIYEREKVRGEDVLKAPRDQSEINHTCYHELGHAVDDISGQLSKSPEFKTALQQDTSRMSDDFKARENYFLEPGEAWAECMGVLLGAKDEEVAQNMPMVRSYLKNRFRL